MTLPSPDPVLVNSLWGYKCHSLQAIGQRFTRWAVQKGPSLSRVVQISPAPDPGLYLIQADLKNLTYSHTPITGLSYAGLNDDWNMVAMDETSVPAYIQAQ